VGAASGKLGRVRVLSHSQLLASIVAMLALALFYLKWIWLSEWTCRRCSRKNLECACSGRWTRYL
jgi:hypothetical protein